ncbi:hypothetical protein LOZ53_005587 [Ophidiomyces ophidiicola]|nr:hypothetical protein LOZ55_006300 [Ophidiomyces ophidiicola]KAI1984128.1 hypothetical protein LOZ53_005587 [Ophidiomyces ophidiicola]KAI1984532.1 hypothetical protein LOZ51_006610 [Ophidiomyces ophidiicola]KAI1987822.1 hypothetical protein LOZ54_003417 [Ophidiomyces ophidiicola]
MRPPRLLLFLGCLIFLPILLTTLSLLSAHPKRDTTAASSDIQRTSRLRALFSFHAPSALFPPSAIISLTEDNSTFFLARPAAFGPLLPSKGLSGALWIGSGFGDDNLRSGGVGVAAEGELGCSDVPGWESGSQTTRPGAGPQSQNQKANRGSEKSEAHLNLNNRQKRGSDDKSRAPAANSPSEDDGTDDHLHHPLHQSQNPNSDRVHNLNDKHRGSTHADIQSLQEGAEISGKVVLLSRGGCGFLEKVKWVQRRGGLALVVGDDTRGGGLVTMYARGDTSNVSIPAVFTSYTTAHLLSSLVPSHRRLDVSKATLDGRRKNRPGSKNGKPATKTTSKPIITLPAKSNVDSSQALHRGYFKSLTSFLRPSLHDAHHSNIHEDSRRPPSSGNLDFKSEHRMSPSKPVDVNVPPRAGSPSDSSAITSAGEFVIGVQDWRDPDLVPVRPSTSASSTTSPTPSPNKPSFKNQGKDWSSLGGESITPASGEYKVIRNDDGVISSGRDETSQGRHWWNGLGKSVHDDKRSILESDRRLSEIRRSHGAFNIPRAALAGFGEGTEHEGLWVTLSPTTMSTSPFFDTLLVLVVSPLITLTVVYALLLLRSRIRRRRWRAPKAIVDRLPVRTYHSIPTISTPNTPTTRPPSPSSPLLSNSRSHSPRPRPRSQTCVPISASSNSLGAGHERAEKSQSGSTLWRRKYTGRQVECVVCLEEYIDGQSRVMSLPCGHEFHAECITPWLTTRRRTCPICKGDVVRSLGAAASGARIEDTEPTSTNGQAQIAEMRNDSPTSTIPIPDDDPDSDLERGASPSTSLLGNSDASTVQPSWRNLANLSLSALSGDSMWHQPRHAHPHRNR